MRAPGVLLIQLGTPDAPTSPALRRYLRQFLGDPRVIEVPRWKWRIILNLLILPFRPKRSAAKYRRIWDPKTASPMDVLFQALMRERRVPSVRIVPPYYEHPAYLDAMTTIIRQELTQLPWQPDHYLLSFHGIPIRYCQSGDPYATHVKRTTARLIERLGWPRERWTQTFQSLFGREEWLKPYTEEKLKQLAAKGIKRVFVAMPGFTSDCLETIDEIGYEARATFRHAGGEELHPCP